MSLIQLLVTLRLNHSLKSPRMIILITFARLQSRRTMGIVWGVLQQATLSAWTGTMDQATLSSTMAHASLMWRTARTMDMQIGTSPRGQSSLSVTTRE